MKIFTKITNRSYSFKALKRTVAGAFIIGFSAAIYTTVAIYPVAIDLYTSLSERVNPTVVVENNTDEETTAINLDKIDEYTDQEITRLTDKYQRLLKEEARMSAIERIEAELEVEKEKLREEQLFQ
jgi:uncharacterized lipoprotein YddW (UPF0748 family)